MHNIHQHQHQQQDNIHTKRQPMDMHRNRNEITTRTIQSNIKRWTDDAIHHPKSTYNQLIWIAIYMLPAPFKRALNGIYVFMIWQNVENIHA